MPKNTTDTKPCAVETGEIFQLGNHLLLCGDATDEVAIQNLLKNQQVKLICCDPPYGVKYVESKQNFTNITMKHKKIENDDLTSEPQYTEFTRRYLSIVKPYLTTQNAAYLFNSDYMIFALREGMKQAGWKFGQLLIWAKTSPVLGRLNYLPQHELIAYGWSGRQSFRKSKDKSVIVHPKIKKNTIHPTMKPIPLLRRLILNSTEVGDTVYDPFGGSGSTLIACAQLKRKCIMVEKDAEYCTAIIKRFQKLFPNESVTKITPTL